MKIINKQKCILKQGHSGWWSIWPYPFDNYIDAASINKNDAYLKASNLGYDIVSVFQYIAPYSEAIKN